MPPRSLGAVASGHTATTDTAVSTLEAGGNAVDAAVAAALAAAVCEPLLTGLGGGGLMTIRDGRSGEVTVVSFFSVFPGLDHGLSPRDFRALRVDYGPTHQTFHAGRGSAAVPGIAPGLEAVWRRWGSLPLERLAAPAVSLARDGWTATHGTQVVSTMLSAITNIGPRSDALFNPGGRPIREGDEVRSPALADALEDFGQQGAAPFVTGRHARALLADFGPPNGSLGPTDLSSLVPAFVPPLAVPVPGGGTLYLPPPPCSGGALLAFGLRLLALLPEPADAIEHVALLASVQAATERARAEGWDERMFEPDAVDALLDPANLARHAADVAAEVPLRGRGPDTPPKGAQPGNTTHLSVVDARGNAVSYTSSNGETCGFLWPGTDIPMNNFLGEDDIHPMGFHLGPAGAGFRTMMTPALLVADDGGIVALGTGGSNRIRTAMLQVTHRLLARGEPLLDAVMAPRIHVEGGTVQVEDIGLGRDWLAAASGGRDLARFEDRHLYFGGVHCAARQADGTMMAVGDPRRSGVGGIATDRSSG